MTGPKEERNLVWYGEYEAVVPEVGFYVALYYWESRSSGSQSYEFGYASKSGGASYDRKAPTEIDSYF